MTVPVALSVSVATELADVVSAMLWSLGPSAIVEDATSAGLVVFTAGFADRARAERATEALAERTAISGLTTEISEFHDEPWLDAWRADARPVRAGRFEVVPAWFTGDVPPGPVTLMGAHDPITVHIDAGRAFGSGSHPSTRLVLEALGDMVADGTSVLDVGCGSGVLSIAAGAAGATRVVGIDIDPAAITTAQRNAVANGVAHRTAMSLDALAAVPGRFDVVVANLLASTIETLGRDLAARVRPGGHLVLSGLLADRWEATAACFPAWPLAAIHSDDGWSAITLLSPSEPDDPRAALAPESVATVRGDV